MFKRDFRRVVVRRREGRDSVSDKDLWTHLREYLECLMWKGSLGFTNVSCKSIREATHHITKTHARAQQRLLEADATFISGTSGWRRSCTSSPLERTTEALDSSSGWQMACLTSCISDELLRMLTFSVLEVRARVAGKV